MEIENKLLKEMRKQPPTMMGFARGIQLGALALIITNIRSINNSPHNTIAKSERIDLLDSDSQVGEQVGSVGNHNSLKDQLPKSKMVAGSEDEDTSQKSEKV